MSPGFISASFLSRRADFFKIIFLHLDYERLQPWDVLCAFFKSLYASALGLKWLCICLQFQQTYFFTFPPQIIVADAKVTKPNGHKHSWRKRKTWQMIIRQPKMDVFPCEHILWVVERLKKPKERQKSKFPHKNKKTGRNDRKHWQPVRMTLYLFNVFRLQSSRSDCCWLAGYQLYLTGYYPFESLHLHRRVLHSPHQEEKGTSWDDRLDRNIGHLLMLRHLYTWEGTDVCDRMKTQVP